MNKNIWQLILINLGLLISPLVIAQFILSTYEGDSAQGAGMALSFFLGILNTFFAMFGLIVSVLTRKSAHAYKYSILSFAIPAALSIAFVLWFLISSGS